MVQPKDEDGHILFTCNDFNSNYRQFEEKVQHAQIKIFSEGSNSAIFFIVDEEREEPNTIKSGS